MREYYQPEKFDTLLDFHLHYPEATPEELITYITSLLKQLNQDNRELIAERLQKLLTNEQARKVLQFICDQLNVDYLSLIPSPKQLKEESAIEEGDSGEGDSGKGIHSQTIPWGLALHVLLLFKCFEDIDIVARVLGIDFADAHQYLEHFKSIFTIDDPLIWLENFNLQFSKQKRKDIASKEKLIHGEAIVNQPVDTAEDRRVKARTRSKTPELL